MNPIEKRNYLKKKFKERREESLRQNKEIVIFRDLKIRFEPEVFERHRQINGGSHYE